ncbi:MAG: hypothetical protein MZV64_09655 [Ignavibacteriales bacterium]|nr:hypothetical protein [Ignavibacteriales bacterium]
MGVALDRGFVDPKVIGDHLVALCLVDPVDHLALPRCRPEFPDQGG